jgi:hypothetical protein
MIRTVLHPGMLHTLVVCTVVLCAVVLYAVIRALARIGMFGAVMGLRRGAALVTGVPAIHANVIGGGMGPR